MPAESHVGTILNTFTTSKHKSMLNLISIVLPSLLSLKVHASNMTYDIREDVKIHNCWLQPICCNIQEQCIAFPI